MGIQNSLTDNDLYQLALNKWGLDFQVAIFQEEVAELVVELSHLRRGRGEIPKVIEELVDVEIMVDQLKVAFKANSPDNDRTQMFEQVRHEKLSRLAKRLLGQISLDDLKPRRDCAT